MRYIKLLSTSIISFAFVNLASAFSFTGVSYFYGNNYTLGDKYLSTLQFEHLSQWGYGDNYVLFDVVNPHQDFTSITGDWVSRFSLSKITKKKIAFGPIEDVLLAGEISFTGANSRTYGPGLGFNIKIPKFEFFILNTIWHFDAHQPGSTIKILADWQMPINISSRVNLQFAGFADYTGRVGTRYANFFTRPRLLLDIGNLVKLKKGKIYGGLQYAYWHNKLGIKCLNESLPEVMFTWYID